MNKSFQYRVVGSVLLPSLKVAKVMGYKENEVPEPFSGLIAEGLKHAGTLLDPKAEIVIYDNPHFDKENCSMMLQEEVFKLESVVHGMVQRSTSVGLFICTIGPGLPEVIRKKSAVGDLLSAYVYDIIGTLAVEAAMDVFQFRLKNEMAQLQQHITNRYSPGYCGWDIREQEMLFKLVPNGFTGVHLSSSCLMQPIKSISGIIGIGEKVKFNQYTCSRCDQKDCLYANLKSERIEGIF